MAILKIKDKNGNFINIPSIIGEQGPQGETGATPNIQIGIVTTLDYNESATVTKTGTLKEPVFNFGIPRGKDGNNGSTNYRDLENKPTINSVELIGNKTLDELNIASKDEIPNVPTKTSELTNDSDFATKEYVDDLVGDIEALLGGI